MKLQFAEEKEKLEEAIRKMRREAPAFNKVMLQQEFSEYMMQMRIYDKKTKIRHREGKIHINPENWDELDQHEKRYLRRELPDDIIRKMKKNAAIERKRK